MTRQTSTAEPHLVTLSPCHFVSSPLRLAFASPALALGGVERWLLTLLDHFSPAIRVVGIGVTSRQWIHPAALAEFARRVPIVTVDHIGSLEALWASADCLMTWGTTDPQRVFAGVRCPIITSVHGEDAVWSARYAQACHAAGHTIVCVSEAVKLVCARSIPAAALTVIDNGIEPARLRPSRDKQAARAALAIPPGALVLATHGRLSGEKHTSELIRTVLALGRNAYGLILGEGDDSCNLRRRAADWGVAERIRFVPHTYQIADVLVAADCWCGFSRAEGFWLAPMEAAAIGLPLVIPEVGIFRTLAAEGVRLWEAVPIAAAPANYAAAIARLQTAPAIATVVRALELRDLVRRRFGAQRMAAEWERLLARIVES